MPLCSYCKKSLDSENEKVLYIRNTKKWIHYDCFIQQKLNMKRPKSIEEITQTANECYRLTLEYINDRKHKDELYKYLQTFYNIVVLPTYFFVKMDSIYNGTYKGLARGIPAEHLLDMWKRKSNYLLKVYAGNQAKGKNLDSMGRINYDLAILLNQYDNYLKWLADTKEQAEQEHMEIKRNIAPKVNVKVIKPKNDFDINEELDEL